MRFLFCALLVFVFFTEFSNGIRDKACDMLVVIDETLAETHGGNVDVIINLVDEHIDGLNDIFHRTVFRDHFSRYYFYAKNVELWYNFCEECNQTQTVFLNEFSSYDTSAYCLAVLLTHRDFPRGIQGLAWRNTVCDDRYNTAFVTFINHRVQSSKADSVMTLAHEIGHSFGAYHDQDTEDCGHMGGHYIMSSNGTSQQNLAFSPCSMQEIDAKMNFLASNKPECFTDRLQKEYHSPSFCGNGITEEGEECDCGLEEHTCADPCCYPGLLAQRHRDANSSARPCHTHPGRQCVAPWHGPLVYGLLLPWVTIASGAIMWTILLCWDYNKSRGLFTHLVPYTSVSQADNTSQRNPQQNNQRAQEYPSSPSQCNKVSSQIQRYENLDPAARRWPPAPGPSHVSWPRSPVTRPSGPAPPPPLLKPSSALGHQTKIRSYTTVPQRAAPSPPK